MSIVQRFLSGLPYLVVFAALFFIELAVFGVSEAILCIVFLYFARQMVASPGLGTRSLIYQALWFVVMGLCASLASLHPIATVVVGALYMFAIVLFSSDDYLPHSFFWLGLGFLLLLAFPVTAPAAIVMRFVGLLVAIAVSVAFVLVARHFLADDAFDIDREYVCQAFGELSAQMGAWIAGEDEPCDAQALFEIAQDYADDEYPTVFCQAGALSGRESYTFALLVAIEQVARTLSAAAAQGAPAEAEKAYFAELSDLFAKFGSTRGKSVYAAARELDAFLDSHSLPYAGHDAAWSGVLGDLCDVMSDTRGSRSEDAFFELPHASRWSRVRESFSVRNVRVRFAAKLAIAAAIAIVLGEVLTTYVGLIFGSWTPVIAYVLLYTFDDETASSTIQRLLGMIAGVAVFIVLALIVPGEVHVAIAVILGLAVALTGFGQIVTIAALTQLVLGALYPSMVLGDTLTTGLLLVFVVAAALSIVAFMLMRARGNDRIQARLLEIERMDAQMMNLIEEGPDGYLLAEDAEFYGDEPEDEALEADESEAEEVAADDETPEEQADEAPAAEEGEYPDEPVEDGYYEADDNLWFNVQPQYYLHMNACLLEDIAMRLEYKEQGLGEGAENHDWLLDAELDKVMQANYGYVMQAGLHK